METNRRSVTTLLLLFGGLFLLFFGLLVSAATFVQGGGAPLGPRVGVVEITGVIEDAKPLMEQIRAFADDEDIRGILVRVDSPGGPVGPFQEIYRELNKAKASKKVVASLASIAASGGYYAICGADRIVANPGTLTGSIGVISQVTHVDEILATFLVRTETYKSGALKDSGSPLRPPTDEDRKLFQSMVDNIYAQFRGTVAKERQLSEESLAAIADGRVLSGEQAKELGLVDNLGNFYDALGQLQELAAFEGKPQLVYPKKDPEELLRQLLDTGMEGLSSALSRRAGSRVEYRLP